VKAEDAAIATCVLVGGLILRFGVRHTPVEILERGRDCWRRFSPEDHRRAARTRRPGNHDRASIARAASSLWPGVA